MLIENEEDIENVKTEGSGKKADIYVNGRGVSIKQSPSSPLYNRLQRANIVEVFSIAGVDNVDRKIEHLDRKVKMYQIGELSSRDLAWQDAFSETDFYALLELLMMRYSPNLGFSRHPAELILEAPSQLTSTAQINMYTFNEFFNVSKDRIVISLRRSWVGQKSDSEHRRALALVRNEGNAPWVFDGAGENGGPRGWRPEVPEEERKTAYYLIIYKNAP